MIHTDPATETAERQEALYAEFQSEPTDLLISALDSTDHDVAYAATLVLRERSQQTPADDVVWSLTGVPADGPHPF